MLPTQLAINGVKFQLGPGGSGKPDALITKGQSIDLPSGDFNKLYIIAASDNGDQQASFKVGQQTTTLTVEDWGGFIGQWDTRVWKPRPDSVTEGGRGGTAQRQVALRKDWAFSANHAKWDLKNSGSPDWSPKYPEDYLGLRTGYIKPATLAWYASHHHTAEGLNQPYAYSYLFVYALDAPAGAKVLTLPSNPNIRILAISTAQEEPAVSPAQPLHDVLTLTTPRAVIETPAQTAAMR